MTVLDEFKKKCKSKESDDSGIEISDNELSASEVLKYILQKWDETSKINKNAIIGGKSKKTLKDRIAVDSLFKLVLTKNTTNEEWKKIVKKMIENDKLLETMIQAIINNVDPGNQKDLDNAYIKLNSLLDAPALLGLEENESSALKRKIASGIDHNFKIRDLALNISPFAMANLKNQADPERLHGKLEPISKDALYNTKSNLRQIQLIPSKDLFKIRQQQVKDHQNNTSATPTGRFLKPSELAGTNVRIPMFIGTNGELIGIVKAKQLKYDNVDGYALQSGSFGTVYVGQNLDTGAQVAIKEIIPKDSQGNIIPFNDDAVQLVKKEIEIMQSVGRLVSHVEKKNQNGEIIGITLVDHLGYGRDYLNTIDDFDKIITDKNGNKLSPEDRKIYLLDMSVKFMEEIQRLHDLGYIHRDIKQENMLWDPVTRQAKLIDFGFAMKRGDQDNQLVGTPITMDPISICLDTTTYDEQSDIYGIGYTLLEILSPKINFTQANETLLSDRKKDANQDIIQAIEELIKLRVRDNDMSISSENFVTWIKYFTPNLYTQSKNEFTLSSELLPNDRKIATTINTMIMPQRNQRGDLKNHISKLKEVKFSFELEAFVKLVEKSNSILSITPEYMENPKIVDYIYKYLTDINNPITAKSLIKRIDPPQSVFLLLEKVAAEKDPSQFEKLYSLVSEVQSQLKLPSLPASKSTKNITENPFHNITANIDKKPLHNIFDAPNLDFALHTVNAIIAKNNANDAKTKLEAFFNLAEKHNNLPALTSKLQNQIVNNLTQLSQPIQVEKPGEFQPNYGKSMSAADQYIKKINDMVQTLNVLETTSSLKDKKPLFEAIYSKIVSLIQSVNVNPIPAGTLLQLKTLEADLKQKGYDTKVAITPPSKPPPPSQVLPANNTQNESVPLPPSVEIRPANLTLSAVKQMNAARLAAQNGADKKPQWKRDPNTSGTNDSPGKWKKNK